MTIAQKQSIAALEVSGIRVTTNEDVLAILKRMPDSQGTYKQVIAFVAEGREMSAVEGNALAAPIIRALSELSDEGLVDATQSILNSETGRMNTLYRLQVGQGKARPAKESWKERALALEAELKELKTKYECACNSIDRLEAFRGDPKP